MRAPGDIKVELLKLRDLRHLPLVKICADSRCSREQVAAALRLEATEPVLRKLDAYLDAKHLHVREKKTELLWRVEQMDRELYRIFGAKTIHILTVQDWPQWKQERHLAAMDYRGKQLLTEYLKRKGIKVRLPDGLNYWKCKDYLQGKGVTLGLADADAGRVLREGPMGKSRFL